MAILTVQDIPAEGLTPTLVAADVAGDEAPVGHGVFLYVANGDTVAHTVTMDTPGSVKGVPIADPVVNVAVGSFAMVPLISVVYRDATTGRAGWTYDAVTGVTVAAAKVLT